MKVKNIVDNLKLFKNCEYITIELNHYPYYIHQDEKAFNKYLNKTVKEIEVVPENDDCSGTIYVMI